MNIVLTLDRPPAEPTPAAQLVRLQARVNMLLRLGCFSSSVLQQVKLLLDNPVFQVGFCHGRV